MPDISLKHSHMTHHYTTTAPYGNSSDNTFIVTTNDKGVIHGSDSKEPPKADDVIIVGQLLEGMVLTDAQIFVQTGMSAGITGSLGFRYEDGEDDEKVPQDTEYFIKAGADLATVGRIRADGSRMDILPKPAYLTLTLAGGTNQQESDLRFVVSGELAGQS